MFIYRACIHTPHTPWRAALQGVLGRRPEQTAARQSAPACTACAVTPDPGLRSPWARRAQEKEKRMKGQSTHASWKSEAEMVLRQQYDS